MANLKKQITIVFLTIFILVKVSPAYYQYQFLPRQLAGYDSTSAFFQASHHPNFLIRVYKGVVDNDTFKALPKIKFSGILFGLTFIGACLIFTLPSTRRRPLVSSFCEAKRYIFQGTLRL
jgi:hypothetical protein